ncbi:transcription factor MUTE-like [Chenopodium quinoa]|uniref:transcription factor MUTE-like n=1 Tax=Chenopodium quinoa TaxID=63459 RepID=UPI000B791287|nr:transcription factor MUTE-like [Chenopodium quinoa]
MENPCMAAEHINQRKHHLRRRHRTPTTHIMSHITVERNRRRQMNDHLKVLRSLTPCFYIKKGDQASIIGGVVEFIKELHQVLQSLESQKRRKSLSPSPGPSPKQLQPSPRQLANANSITNHSFQFDCGKELVASCNSPVADVEAKISGSNVVLRVISKRTHGQLLKIISTLEKLSFEILHLNISSMDDTVLYYFVVKIGLECQLSMEELAAEVQRCFCTNDTINNITEI